MNEDDDFTELLDASVTDEEDLAEEDDSFAEDNLSVEEDETFTEDDDFSELLDSSFAEDDSAELLDFSLTEDDEFPEPLSLEPSDVESLDSTVYSSAPKAFSNSS